MNPFPNKKNLIKIWNSEPSIKLDELIPLDFVDFLLVAKSSLKQDEYQHFQISTICGFNAYLERYFFGILKCSNFNFQTLFSWKFLIFPDYVCASNICIFFVRFQFFHFESFSKFWLKYNFDFESSKFHFFSSKFHKLIFSWWIWTFFMNFEWILKFWILSKLLKFGFFEWWISERWYMKIPPPPK